MTFSRFSTILLVLLIAASTTKAQSTGYVITTKGDTIRCTVSSNLLLSRCRYKTDTSKKAITIEKENIKEFCQPDKDIAFRLLTSPESGQLRFIRVIERGKITLYEERILVNKVTDINADNMVAYLGSRHNVNEPGLTTNDHINAYYSNFYAEKGNSGLIVLIKSRILDNLSGSDRKARKTAFIQMLADNSAVSQQFLADKEFTADEVRSMVHLYNTGKPYKSPENDDGGLSPDFNPGGN